MPRYAASMWRRILRLAILASVAPAAHARPSDTAQSFIDRVVAYETSDQTSIRSRAFLNLFSPRLRVAIQQDVHGQDVGLLDYDPICQCQDNAGLVMRLVSLTVIGPTATAHLESIGADQRESITLNLASRSGRWEITDISTAKQASLLKALQPASWNGR